MSHTFKLLIFCLVFTMIGESMCAQYYRNQGYWKKDRFSLTGGLGASNFLGELGGRDQVGSDFIWDLDTKEFKPVLSIGIRYVTTRKMSVRGQFSYAVIGGDDALTQERFRFNRNLHFQSNLYELSLIGEYILYSVRPGHRYNLTGLKGNKPRAAHIYAFLGVAGIKFNPKAKVEDEWYALQPLGTEGQNIKEGVSPYSLYSIAIPFGIGYRWRIANNNMMIGVEIGHRITFTDYLDDVSTVYSNQEELLDQPGLNPEENIIAAFLADPSLGYYIDENNDEIPLNSTFEGAQRGDETDNDSYLFVQATLMYTLGKKQYKKKSYSTKKGKRIVF